MNRRTFLALPFVAPLAPAIARIAESPKVAAACPTLPDYAKPIVTATLSINKGTVEDPVWVVVGEIHDLKWIPK